MELLIGIIAFLVLLSAILQITSLSNAMTETSRTARAEAGTRAMSDIETLYPASYIRNWQEGRDGKAYTRDDIEMGGGIGPANAILYYALPDSPSPGTTEFAMENFPPYRSFGLYRASDTRSVPLLPAVRELLYKKDAINVESTVWMTWTKGIY